MKGSTSAVSPLTVRQSDLFALALTRLRIDIMKVWITRGLVSLVSPGLQTLTLAPGVLRHTHTGAHLVTQTSRQSAPGKRLSEF